MLLPAIKPPFHYWRFFFSPHGRVSRKAIWYFALPEKVALHILGWSLTYIVQQQIDYPQSSPWMIGITIVGLVDLILMWPVFAVVAKRLHDVGLTALFAFPPFLSLAWLLFPMVSIATGFQTAAGYFEYINMVMQWISIYYLLLIAVLAVVPGQKTTNRFGPPVTGPEDDEAKHF